MNALADRRVMFAVDDIDGAKFGVVGRQDCSELPTVPTSDWIQAFYAPRSTA